MEEQLERRREGRDMQTEERVITKPILAPVPDEKHPAAVRQEPRPEMEIPDLLRRVIFVGLGFGSR
jgi:hypothetical protein